VVVVVVVAVATVIVHKISGARQMSTQVDVAKNATTSTTFPFVLVATLWGSCPVDSRGHVFFFCH